MRGLLRASLEQGGGGFCRVTAERMGQGWVVPAVREAASAWGAARASASALLQPLLQEEREERDGETC